ncbi:MAG: galactose-1-phosphate uridylyltransferase, partial [Proteobacteria bacterium]|nr:galactose-1-phosphate uridylyltransferase [Pseudomonadota bacterium]
GLSAEGNTGHCEVILYSPEHNKSLGACSLLQIEGIIQVWQDRSRVVGAMPEIQQVFIFENKGAEVGVTLHHPHGQLYAFHHKPPVLAREMAAAQGYYESKGHCLICDMAREEAEGPRLVGRTDRLVAYVPKAARYPYEVHLTSLEHRTRIEDLNATECVELARLLKTVIQKYNQVLQMEFPYIMVHHQCGRDENEAPHYHWHIEFYPPYRAPGKLKFLAGVESGTGLFINDSIPEVKAAELRSYPVDIESR